MKKYFLCCLFVFLSLPLFAQAPGVAVSDFTVRAKDVSADEALAITDMFINALIADKKVTVVSRAALTNQAAAANFQAADWADSAKTAQLGASLRADFLISGTITQLGDNITVNVTARDIKTLAVIKSEQRQWKAEDIWNTAPRYVNGVPYGTGLPVWIPVWAGSLSSGITAEFARQQKALQEQLAKEEAERQAQLARAEAEQKAEEERIRRETYPITGRWNYSSVSAYPYGSARPTQLDNVVYCYITFNADGTATGYRDYWSSVSAYNSSGVLVEDHNVKNHTQVTYSGTYTREGTAIKVTWRTVETAVTGWENKENWFTGVRTWETQNTNKRTASNSADSCTLNFTGNGVSIYWQGYGLRQ